MPLRGPYACFAASNPSCPVQIACPAEAKNLETTFHGPEKHLTNIPIEKEPGNEGPAQESFLATHADHVMKKLFLVSQ